MPDKRKSLCSHEIKNGTTMLKHQVGILDSRKGYNFSLTSVHDLGIQFHKILVLLYLQPAGGIIVFKHHILMAAILEIIFRPIAV